MSDQFVREHGGFKDLFINSISHDVKKINTESCENINCVNCKRCVNCVNCVDCSNCVGCKNCTNCHNCMYLDNARNVKL